MPNNWTSEQIEKSITTILDSQHQIPQQLMLLINNIYIDLNAQIEEKALLIENLQTRLAEHMMPVVKKEERNLEQAWDVRPEDASNIEVYSVALEKWLVAVYEDDGIDGLLYFPVDDDTAELEEYHELFPKWRYFDEKTSA